MRLDLELDKQVAGFAVFRTRLPLMLQFYDRALASRRGYVYIDCLRTGRVTRPPASRANAVRRRSVTAASRASARALKRDPVPSTFVSVFETNFHLGFGILSAFRFVAHASASMFGLSRGPCAAENRLGEIAKPAA